MADRFSFDRNGWAHPVARIPSPNCDERPAHSPIELVVIHGISLPPGQFSGRAVEQLFTNQLDCDRHPYYGTLRMLKVSAHFFIRRDGAVLQFVPCLLRAWHAGVSQWRGRDRCNDFSIGVELEGADDVEYENDQYAVCNALLEALARVYPVKAAVGHCDVAPGRKTDPGPCFDWTRIVALPRS
jgi:AmpD protein